MNTIQLAKKESSDSKMLYKMNRDFIKMKNENIAEGNHKIIVSFLYYANSNY
jgi:hypothetical protein